MIKKISKKKIASLARSAKRQQWSECRLKILERDQYKCVICGNKEHLQVHHLIPRTVKEHWLNHENLITVCASCHKWNKNLSFHGNPFAAAKWMQNNRMSQYLWVMANV